MTPLITSSEALCKDNKVNNFMKTDKQIHFWAHMLDEAFNKHMLTEGKHWPEDYIKTAINLIKQSPIG